MATIEIKMSLDSDFDVTREALRSAPAFIADVQAAYTQPKRVLVADVPEALRSASSPEQIKAAMRNYLKKTPDTLATRPDMFMMAIALHENSYAASYLERADFVPVFQTPQGLTPLMIAVIYKNHDMVRQIAAHPLVQPDYHATNGLTAIQLAAAMGIDESVKILLDAGCDPFRRLNADKNENCSVWSLRPHIVEAHPLFTKNAGYQERVTQREEKKKAFLAAQQTLKRLAAGLPAEEEKPSTLSGIIFTEKTEDVDVIAEVTEPVVTRDDILSDIAKKRDSSLICNFINDELETAESFTTAVSPVLDYIDPVTFDKVLVACNDIITTACKAHLKEEIKACGRWKDLEPAYNHRLMPSRKFVSELDHNASLMNSVIDSTLKSRGDLTAVFKRHSFSLNLDASLRKYKDCLHRTQIMAIGHHMKSQGRDDMVSVVQKYL